MEVPKMSDAQSVLQNHYKDASRLDARRQLHAKYSTNTYSFLAWVFEHLRLPSTCQVLEVGCGAGYLWLANRHRIPGGWDVTLADFSAGMLATAHHQLRVCGHAFRFVAHDAQALPFAAHSFDAIIANHMLYHVPNRPAAYAEFCRVLKPSGQVYAATNSKDNMRELDALIQRFRHARSPESGTARPMNDSRLRDGFNLEHGAEEISQWFISVTLHRYADALVVPEAESLVAYVRSTGRLTEDELTRFQDHIEAVLAQHGPLRISKDVGMFEASQPLAS
jgi:ubiquinone/menaquinone biosynthesis C-methylase UbiE